MWQSVVKKNELVPYNAWELMSDPLTARLTTNTDGVVSHLAHNKRCLPL
jgi:hypothetical protein